ncbi:MAG: TolC family protein [Deltaproteobacteria bacterium]|nr:TolC family protein [Deltaproteobacteria bacterium]
MRAWMGVAVLALCAGLPSMARAQARVVRLADAEKSALEHQPQLAIARASVEAADARAGQAFAPLLPQLAATAGYQRTTANVIVRPGTTAASVTPDSNFDTYNSWSTSVTANQLVWDFGQGLGKWRAAQSTRLSADETARSVAQTALLNVRAAFFAARADKALLQVAQDTLANQEKHLQQTQAFVTAGTRPDIDLAQSRADVANAKLSLVDADNNYANAKQSLNVAMGAPGPIDYDVADDALQAVQGEDAALDGLLDEAQKARPELKSLELQAQAEQQTLGAIRGGYGPALSVNAGFTQGGLALDKLGWNLSVGATLSWQLFQGGATKEAVREAEANLSSLAAQADGVRQQIRADLDSARLAVKAAQSARAASADALASLKDRLRLAESRYQNGLGSLLDLDDAQLATSTAAAQVITADFRLATARAQLLRALGRN